MARTTRTLFFVSFLVGVILAIDKPLLILQSPVVSETP